MKNYQELLNNAKPLLVGAAVYTGMMGVYTASQLANNREVFGEHFAGISFVIATYTVGASAFTYLVQKHAEEKERENGEKQEKSL